MLVGIVVVDGVGRVVIVDGGGGIGVVLLHIIVYLWKSTCISM